MATDIHSADSWLVGNRSLLANKLEVSRTWLYERLVVAKVPTPETGPYCLAWGFAAALEADIDVPPATEVFPPMPEMTAEPSGASLVSLVRDFHDRSNHLIGLVNSRRRLEPGVHEAAIDGYLTIVEWYQAAFAAALPPAQRAELGTDYLADLDCWGYTPAQIGLPPAQAG